MPQLPVISPGQTKMTTASPNRRLDPSAESQPGRDVAMMGKAVAQMGFRMQEVQNQQQSVKATNSASAKRNKILSDAQNDSDFSDERKAYYNSELIKIAPNEAQGISSPSTRAMFIANSEGSTAAASLKIETNFRTKMLKDYEAQTNQSIYDNKVAYATAITPAGRKIALDNSFRTLKGAKDIGVYDSAAHSKKKLALLDEFKDFAIQSSIQLDPISETNTTTDNVNKVKAAIVDIQSNKHALPMDKRIEAQKSADIMLKRALAEDVEATKTQVDANEAGLTKMGLRDMTVTQVLQYNEEHPISVKLLDKIIEWKKSPTAIGTKVETDKQIYTDMADNLAEPGKLISKTRLQIMTAIADSKIDGQKGLELDALLDMLGEEAVNHKTKDGGFIRAIQSSFERINKAATIFGGGAMAYEGIKSIVEGIVKNDIKTPEQVKEQADKVIKGGRLIVNPEIANASEDGTLIHDKYGNRLIVYPDGSYKAAK